MANPKGLTAQFPQTTFAQLRNDLLATNDGTGNQLWKERHEDSVVGKGRAGHFSLPDIDQVGDLLKSEKGDG